MSNLATAFVRLRPNTTGFKAEAERDVRSGLGGVGKIIGGAFAAVGIEQGVKAVATAAAAQQEELAVVRQSIKSTGSAWVIHGKTVETTLRSIAVAQGFTVADLAQGFTRIQVSTKDTSKTLSLLGDAENIARARHLGLAQAAVVVAKAQAGNVTGLQRLGIVIPKVTANYDALKRKLDNATASGAKFTGEQKLSNKEALAAAKARDKEATKARVLFEIQSRFGGQAANYAKTAQGSFQRFHEAVNELEVSIGNGLLPVLTNAASGASRLFKHLADGGQVSAFAAGTARELASAYGLVKSIAQAVAPPLVAIAKAVGEVAHAAGGGGIVAFALGFKALAVYGSIATSVRLKYNAAIAAGLGTAAAETTAAKANADATVQKTAATIAATEGVDTESVSLARNVDAMLAAEAAAARLAATQETLAAKYAITNIAAFGGGNIIRDAGGKFVTSTAKLDAFAGSADRAGSKIGALGKGLFALAGGWSTVAAVGLGAVAFGIYKLVTAEDSWDRANKRLINSTSELDRVTQRAVDARKALAQVKAALPTDKLALDNAKLAVRDAEAALFASHAKRDSSEFLHLQAGVLQALQDRHDAQKRVNDDQAALVKHTADSKSADNQAAAAVRERAKEIQDLAKQARAAADPIKALRASSRKGELVNQAAATAAEARAQKAAVDRFANSVDAAAEKQKNSAIKRGEHLVAALARQTNKIPTDKVIAGFVERAAPKSTIGGLKFSIDSAAKEAKPAATKVGHDVGWSFVHGAGGGVHAGTPFFKESIRRFIDSGYKEAKAANESHSPSLRAAREIGVPLMQGVALGITTEEKKTTAVLTDAITRMLAAASKVKIATVPGKAPSSRPAPVRRRSEPQSQSVRPAPAPSHRRPTRQSESIRPARVRAIEASPKRPAPPSPIAAPPKRPVPARELPALPKKEPRPVPVPLRGLSGRQSATVVVKPHLDTSTLAAEVTKLRKSGRTAGEAYANGIVAGLRDKTGAVLDSVTSLLVKAVESGREAIGARSPSQVAREGIGHAISDGIALGILDRNGDVIKTITSQVDQAIIAGVQAVKDSVNSAKQNLNSIGGGLAGDINTLLTKRGADPTKATGPQAQRLKELMARVQSGNADASTLRLAQTLSDQAVQKQAIAQQSGTGVTDRVTRQIADLTDRLNRGDIRTQKQFDKALDAILRKAGVSGKAGDRSLGIAFGDQLRADIRGLREQAAAILASPKVKGSGLDPQIVQPLVEIRNQQKSVADAAANQRAQQIQQAKNLLAEQKKHRKYLADIAAHTKGSTTTEDLKRWVKWAEAHPKASEKALAAALNRVGR